MKSPRGSHASLPRSIVGASKVTKHCAICEHPKRQDFELAREHFGGKAKRGGAA